MNYIVAVTTDAAQQFATIREWAAGEWTTVLSPSDLSGVTGATVWVVAFGAENYPMTPEMASAITAARANL